MIIIMPINIALQIHLPVATIVHCTEVDKKNKIRIKMLNYKDEHLLMIWLYYYRFRE